MTHPPPDKPIAVGAMQYAGLGPRVVIVTADGRALAFTPDQARELALQIKVAANDAELGRQSDSFAQVLATLRFMHQELADGTPRH